MLKENQVVANLKKYWSKEKMKNGQTNAKNSTSTYKVNRKQNSSK
jgi:hypothetical protein